MDSGAQIMTDFTACRWPPGMQDEAIARTLDEAQRGQF